MEQIPARKRRAMGTLIAMPVLFACIEFSNIARNPRFEQIHNVDIIGLMAVGACIGVAMTGLAVLIRTRNKAD
jgi:hypothetical protein